MQCWRAKLSAVKVCGASSSDLLAMDQVVQRREMADFQTVYESQSCCWEHSSNQSACEPPARSWDYFAEVRARTVSLFATDPLTVSVALSTMPNAASTREPSREFFLTDIARLYRSKRAVIRGTFLPFFERDRTKLRLALNLTAARAGRIRRYPPSSNHPPALPPSCCAHSG